MRRKAGHVYLYDKSYKNKAYEKIRIRKSGKWDMGLWGREDLNGVLLYVKGEYENQTYEWWIHMPKPVASMANEEWLSAYAGLIWGLGGGPRPPLKSALDTILCEAHLKGLYHS